jgi:hypothetical protein
MRRFAPTMRRPSYRGRFTVSEGKRFSTIRTLIDRNAMLYADRIAMKEMEGDRVLTYAVLRDRVNRMRNARHRHWCFRPWHFDLSGNSR